MKTRTIQWITCVVSSLLVLSAFVATSWAEPPGRKVVFEAYSSPMPDGSWEGPVTIWIDGFKYEGDVT